MDNERIEMLNGLNARYEALNEQLKIIEQQLIELGVFTEELDAISQNKDKEILAPIGKGVFAPVKINSDKKLLVEVGSGYFINKDVQETKSVINDQRGRLESFRIQVVAELDNLTKELQEMII